MVSVMGLLEEREAAARVRVEALQAEADRIVEELGEAQAVLERRVIAVAELARPERRRTRRCPRPDTRDVEAPRGAGQRCLDLRGMASRHFVSIRGSLTCVPTEL